MGVRDKLGNWLAEKFFVTTDAGEPGRASSPACELVNGEVFEDDLIDIEQTPASHASHFERYRKLIDSFDEDRESPLEKMVRWLFLLLAYALPLVVAYAMGKEIGDAYGGRFDWNSGWSLGTHTVAMAGEFALAMMTLSAATALRRMATDASYAAKFIGSLVSFLLFSLASGLAQWFIASAHILVHDTSGIAALIFRVAMVPTLSVSFINRVLSTYHSPAAGLGQALSDGGVHYHIDPVYALAFFLHESSFGTTGWGAVNHSLGNIRCSAGYSCQGGYRSYPTWQAGFLDWYQLIRNLYIKQWHLSTVAQIIPVYAPASDHNDVHGYIRSVEHAVDAWRSGKVLL